MSVLALVSKPARMKMKMLLMTAAGEMVGSSRDASVLSPARTRDSVGLVY